MSDHKPLSRISELVTDRIVYKKDASLPYIGLEHIEQGSPFLLGKGESQDSTSTNAMFRPSDILFGKLRPNLRKSLQVDFDGYCSTDILVIRACAGYSPEFVARVFQQESVFKYAEQTAIGTKMPRTSWHDLEQFAVFVPGDIDEQALIAVILDTVDDAIRYTEQMIVKLKQVRAGLLHDLLTYGIDENGDLRDPVRHPEQFKESELGLVPRAWSVEPLSCYTLSSAFGPRFPSNTYREDGNVATMRTTDMDDEGNLNLGTMPLAQLNLESFRPHLLEENDLLVSRSGTCGIAAVFEGFRLPVLPGAFLIRFRLKSNLRPQYLRRYFNWETGRSRLLIEAEGGVQKNIKGSAMLRLPIPVPPESEQEQILAILTAHENAMDTESSDLAKMHLLKQGLMDDLLTGRVRVVNLLNEEE